MKRKRFSEEQTIGILNETTFYRWKANLGGLAVSDANLVLAKGYLCKLLGNARVLRYLTQHHQEILTEFQRIADLETVAA